MIIEFDVNYQNMFSIFQECEEMLINHLYVTGHTYVNYENCIDIILELRDHNLFLDLLILNRLCDNGKYDILYNQLDSLQDIKMSVLADLMEYFDNIDCGMKHITYNKHYGYI